MWARFAVVAIEAPNGAASNTGGYRSQPVIEARRAHCQGGAYGGVPIGPSVHGGAMYSQIDNRVWGDRRFLELGPWPCTPPTLWMALLAPPAHLKTSVTGLILGGPVAFSEAMGWPSPEVDDVVSEVWEAVLTSMPITYETAQGKIWAPSDRSPTGSRNDYRDRSDRSPTGSRNDYRDRSDRSPTGPRNDYRDRSVRQMDHGSVPDRSPTGSRGNRSRNDYGDRSIGPRNDYRDRSPQRLQGPIMFLHRGPDYTPPRNANAVKTWADRLRDCPETPLRARIAGTVLLVISRMDNGPAWVDTFHDRFAGEIGEPFIREEEAHGRWHSRSVPATITGTDRIGPRNDCGDRSKSSVDRSPQRLPTRNRNRKIEIKGTDPTPDGEAPDTMTHLVEAWGEPHSADMATRASRLLEGLPASEVQKAVKNCEARTAAPHWAYGIKCLASQRKLWLKRGRERAAREAKSAAVRREEAYQPGEREASEEALKAAKEAMRGSGKGWT